MISISAAVRKATGLTGRPISVTLAFADPAAGDPPADFAAALAADEQAASQPP